MAAFDAKPISGNPWEIDGLAKYYTKDALRLFALEKQLMRPVGFSSVFWNYYAEHLQRAAVKIRVIAKRYNQIGRTLEAYAADFKEYKERSDEAVVNVQRLSGILNHYHQQAAKIPARYPPVPLDKINPGLAMDIKRAKYNLDAALDDLREIATKFARHARAYAASSAFQPFDGSSGLRDPSNEVQLEKYIVRAMRYEKYWRKISQNTVVKVAGFLPFVGATASVYSLTGLANIKAALEVRLRAGDESARLQLAEVNRQMVEATVAVALGLVGGKGVEKYTGSKVSQYLYKTSVELLGMKVAQQLRDYQSGVAQLKRDKFVIPSNTNPAVGVVYNTENYVYNQAISELNPTRRDDNDPRTSTVTLLRDDGVLKLYRNA